MPLTIPNKNTGDLLTAAEFNELLGAVNDFVDSNFNVTESMVSDLGNYLEVSDLDTLAKVNSIISDATLIDTNDARLSDDRNPLAHTHLHSEITDYDTELAGKLNTTAFTPSADYHPATKKYVDDEIAGAGGYTDEQAQDAVGNILIDTAEIDLTYDDATPAISAAIIAGSIVNSKLANMAQDTLKGRVSVGAGSAEDLTAAQVRTLLNVEDGATADMSDAEIKTAYENNADTNAFTDAEQTKVGNLSFSAPVGNTDGTLRILADVNTDGTYTVVDWTPPTGGGGEANTASNLAGDEGIFTTKSGVDLPFKSLSAGTNITLSSDANTITINSTAGGGNVSNTGTPLDGQIPVWTDATTIEGTPELTYDGTKLSVNHNQNGVSFTRMLELIIPDLGTQSNNWAQIGLGKEASTGNMAEFSFNYQGDGDPDNAFQLGLFNVQHLALKRNGNIGILQEKIEVLAIESGFTDHTYLEFEPDASNNKPAMVLIDVKNSTAGIPTIFGGIDLNGPGKGMRWQFGDEWNVIENQFNHGMILRSFHTMVYDGGAADATTPVDFTDNKYSTDDAEGHRFLLKDGKSIVFRDRDAAARTADWLVLQNEDKTAIRTIIDSSGFVPYASITGVPSFLEAADIDTLAELNAIITDATLIDTTDARLSDARTPTSHTHGVADITPLSQDRILGRVSSGSGAAEELTAAQMRTLINVEDGSQANVVPEEDTPTTVLTLDNVLGRYGNLGSANTNTTFTTTGTTFGAFCQVLINAASKPSVTGGTEVAGSTFAASTDMYMFVQYMGATRGVEFWFREI